MAKRTTRVTVETHSFTTWRMRGSASAKRCTACGAETQAVTVEQAAGICSVTQRTIFRFVEADRLHAHSRAEGELLICAESLRRLVAEAARGESP